MMELERSLVFLDAEATGVNTEEDRVVELTIARFEPGCTEAPEIKSRLINPTIPIPPEATAVHGITDADVADSPTFAAIALSLHQHLEAVDFGGYNIIGYDLPLLEVEFARCKLAFPWQQQGCVDGFAIFCQREPRDLAGALMFYTGLELEDAHRSGVDVQAAIDVVAGQYNRYDLENNVTALDAAGRRPEWADRQGKIIITDGGDLAFGFGKHYGKPINSQVGYLRWMLEQNFPTDTRAIIGTVVQAHESAKQQQQELPS